MKRTAAVTLKGCPWVECQPGAPASTWRERRSVLTPPLFRARTCSIVLSFWRELVLEKSRAPPARVVGRGLCLSPILHETLRRPRHSSCCICASSRVRGCVAGCGGEGSAGRGLERHAQRRCSAEAFHGPSDAIARCPHRNCKASKPSWYVGK